VNSRIPYPTLHSGLTPDDLPYGYSAYGSVFDDASGYEPMVVGYDASPESRLVIIVALSPGRYVPCTMVSAGWDPEQACKAVLDGFTAARPPGVPVSTAPQLGSARAPLSGPITREAS
jgi:hypothetical protein